MSTRALTIANVTINDEAPCFVIAEIGHNHQGDLQRAKELFRAAKEAGASAVKLQKRENRSLFTRGMYEQPYEHENSFGRTYGEHREYLEFGEAEYRELQAYATDLDIVFFSTAFDRPSVDFLARLDMPAYKIASADLRNTPLLRHVAETGKPVIVSTGGGTMGDVQRAYDTIMPINPRLSILQCTASYPTAFGELDLGVIRTFRESFPRNVIGLSAHDSGIAMALVGYVLGARIIEKHFTLNRAMKGTDHAFSLEPAGLRKLVRDLTRARTAMVDGTKRVHPSEVAGITKMGKKLVASRALPAGHILTDGDIAFKSPGDGLPPYEFNNVVGRVTVRALNPDDAITFEVLRDGAR
jgi:N-acetylneuraminate synthase/sialic acid synthase